MSNMKDRLAQFMQGRHGIDALSNFLVILGVILMFVSFIPGLALFQWLSLVLLIVAIIRAYSRNTAARERENAAFVRLFEKPMGAISLAKTKREHPDTDYFRCKGCGQILSVPKGKGMMRVVCPKCKTEDMHKS